MELTTSPKVAVITGANSMDAKTLARFLQHKNYKVILTFRRNSLFDKTKWFEETQIEPQNLFKFSFEVCEITDQNSVRECIRTILDIHSYISELYMLAAMSHVGYSFTQKEYSIMANGQSYYFFLEAVKDFTPTTRVYGALTSELAGHVPDGYVFTEETIWHPRSPYSIGKALGGHWIQFYRESLDSQLFACFGILFNHSNWFRTQDFFIMKVCRAAAEIHENKRTTLPLGNLNFYRDEHWSDFGVEMMWKMLQRDTPKDYVIGTGECHHGEEYLDLAFGYFGLDWKDYVEFDIAYSRPNEVVRLLSDSSLAQKELGWNPKRMSFKTHVNLLCSYNHHMITNTPYKMPNTYEVYASA